jgi:hypothetical protein
MNFCYSKLRIIWLVWEVDYACYMKLLQKPSTKSRQHIGNTVDWWVKNFGCVLSVKGSQCIRLTTSLPSVSQFRKCGASMSQAYGPLWPVIGIAYVMQSQIN